MPAKLGGFRSPKGIRKPELKGAGMGGKPMVNPVGSSMGASPMMGGMPGMKKGGVVKKKAKGKK